MHRRHQTHVLEDFENIHKDTKQVSRSTSTNKFQVVLDASIKTKMTMQSVDYSNVISLNGWKVICPKK